MKTKRRHAAIEWEHVAWVDSESEPGVEHEVRRRVSTGTIICTCLGYRFSQSPKHCKHLAALRLVEARPGQSTRPITAAIRAVAATHEVRVAAVGGETFRVRRAISFWAIQ